MGDQEKQKTCFVVMGFGKKTDFTTGRVLDLDKTYRNIIKPAATTAGLQCVRADEIVHSGIIDVPMFRQLLLADVVVADVSTYNCNAFYELGVRHALRPHTTITIAEDKMTFPFDINHIAVRKYTHLGEGIDFEEVERMREDLRKAIAAIAAQASNDSPVYQFLDGLQPPVLAALNAASASGGGSTSTTTLSSPAAALKAGDGGAAASATISVLMEQADAAMDRSDFVTAKALLTSVANMRTGDPFIIQKLALATYKSKLPTPMEALKEAWELLWQLNPERSTDTETLGLCGAVRKRMWDLTSDPAHLDVAIHSYEKGFYLKNDYYNGINLAFLYNVRAAQPGAAKAEAITDFVLAQRIRRQVIPLCDEAMNLKPAPAQAYWVLATKAEAYFGLGDQVKSQECMNEALALQPPPADWMKGSTNDQLGVLSKLLEKSPLSGLA